MAYTHSQASIVPQPKLWLHNAMDHGLLVPKSKPIAFARIPFYLSNLGDTEVMVEMINQVSLFKDVSNFFFWNLLNYFS
jgi:hypothetical protein